MNTKSEGGVTSVMGVILLVAVTITLTLPIVGNSTSVLAPHPDNPNHVVVSSAFVDGSEQVVLDTYV